MFFTVVFNGHSQLLRQGGGSTAEGNSIEDLFFKFFCMHFSRDDNNPRRVH